MWGDYSGTERESEKNMQQQQREEILNTQENRTKRGEGMKQHNEK